MLAVVAIFAMLMAFFVPRLGASRQVALRDDARALAAGIEWARQRAAVTGKPHLLRLDVPNGSYRVEWRISEAEANGEEPPWPEPLDADVAEYRPIPDSMFGRWLFLGPQFDFEGVEVDGSFLTRGDVELVFEPDGSTDWAEISVIDPDANLGVLLTVRPMIDAVRIRDADDA